MRKIGGLVNLLPFTYTIILIGSLSLIALPFLTGFYSKDLILEVAFGQYLFTGHMAYWLGTLSAVFTAFYSLRLLSLTFLTYPNGPKINYLSTHEADPSGGLHTKGVEAPLIMAIPLVILAIISIFFGYLARDLFVGVGSDFWGNSLFVHPNHVSLIEAEFGIPLLYKLLPLIGSLFGAGLALILYNLTPLFTINLTNTLVGKELYRFFNQKYYFDNIYNNLFLNPIINFGYITNKNLDKGSIELLGSHGLVKVFQLASKRIISLDSGSIPHYGLYIFLGIITFTSFIFYVGDPKIFILLLLVLLLLPNMRVPRGPSDPR